MNDFWFDDWMWKICLHVMRQDFYRLLSSCQFFPCFMTLNCELTQKMVRLYPSVSHLHSHKIWHGPMQNDISSIFLDRHIFWYLSDQIIPCLSPPGIPWCRFRKGIVALNSEGHFCLHRLFYRLMNQGNHLLTGHWPGRHEHRHYIWCTQIFPSLDLGKWLHW